MENGKLLLLFDGSESSFKAVDYVGGVARNCSGCEVTICFISEQSSIQNENHNSVYFETESIANDALESAKLKLMQRGIPKGYVSLEIFCKTDGYLSSDGYCSDIIAQRVLEFRKKENFGTVVVGIKKSNLFMRSVINKIIDDPVNFTVWIVG